MLDGEGMKGPGLIRTIARCFDSSATGQRFTAGISGCFKAERNQPTAGLEDDRQIGVEGR